MSNEQLAISNEKEERSRSSAGEKPAGGRELHELREKREDSSLRPLINDERAAQ
jgi:hypothetical protein